LLLRSSPQDVLILFSSQTKNFPWEGARHKGCPVSNELEASRTKVREEICELFKARWPFQSPEIQMFHVPGLTLLCKHQKLLQKLERGPFGGCSAMPWLLLT